LHWKCEFLELKIPQRFHLRVVVEGSPDLVNWLPMTTNMLSGLFDFTDSQNSRGSNRFYRARVP